MPRVNYQLPMEPGKFNRGRRNELDVQSQLRRPSFQFGELCGWIFGDGTMGKINGGGYRFTFRTTKTETLNCIRNVIGEALPAKRAGESGLVNTKPFPNGTVRTAQEYYLYFSSEALYRALRPFKYWDFWVVPSFIRRSQRAKRGFLRGIFDAEGTIAKPGIWKHNGTQCRRSRQISLSSKHIQNLKQVQSLLLQLGIESHIYPRGNNSSTPCLCIMHKSSKVLFRDVIGFRLDYKRENLETELHNSKNVADGDEIQRLRSQGMLLREIGGKVGLTESGVSYRLRKGRLSKS